MAKATAKAILSIKDYKKAGKDLNTILAADDDGNPAIPVKGTEDEIKAKLIEAIQFVTPEDKLKKPTCVVLEALAAEVADAPEKEEVPAPTPRPTAAQIQKMNKKDLEQLCDDLELETDPDDYEKVKDLKAAMIAEMFPESTEKEDPADIGETGNEKATDPEPVKEKELPSVEKKKGKKPAGKKKPDNKSWITAASIAVKSVNKNGKIDLKKCIAQTNKEKGIENDKEALRHIRIVIPVLTNYGIALEIIK